MSVWTLAVHMEIAHAQVSMAFSGGPGCLSDGISPPPPPHSLPQPPCTSCPCPSTQHDVCPCPTSFAWKSLPQTTKFSLSPCTSFHHPSLCCPISPLSIYHFSGTLNYSAHQYPRLDEASDKSKTLGILCSCLSPGAWDSTCHRVEIQYVFVGSVH